MLIRSLLSCTLLALVLIAAAPGLAWAGMFDAGGGENVALQLPRKVAGLRRGHHERASERDARTHVRHHESSVFLISVIAGLLGIGAVRAARQKRGART